MWGFSKALPGFPLGSDSIARFWDCFGGLKEVSVAPASPRKTSIKLKPTRNLMVRSDTGIEYSFGEAGLALEADGSLQSSLMNFDPPISKSALRAARKIEQYSAR